MRSWLTLCGILVISVCCVAQPPAKNYKVNPGEKVMYALPLEVRYIYPDFRTGVVQFRNGRIGGGPMNYSSLLEEMEFITDKDTMALDDIESVRYIHFEKDTFYRVSKFFVRQIATNGEYRLCERRMVSLVNRERYGGHGELQSATTINTVDQLSSGVNTLRQMVAKELMTFTLDRTYYFGDRYGNFKLANKKNLLDMFGKKYPALENFLAQNKINYMKEDDMRLVLEFLSIDDQKKK